MKWLLSIFAALLLPFTIINFCGEIVAGIWLACIGQWKALGVGIVIHLASVLIVTALMLPTVIVAAPGLFATKLGWKPVAILFAGLAYLTTPAVLVGWGFLMLTFFPRMGSPDAFVPLLLWSYGAATGPWIYMLHKSRNEPDPGLMGLHIGCLAVGYIIAMLARWLGDASMQTCFWILAGTMSVACLIYATSAVDYSRMLGFVRSDDDAAKP